jgi:hypothetical protein
VLDDPFFTASVAAQYAGGALSILTPNQITATGNWAATSVGGLDYLIVSGSSYAFWDGNHFAPQTNTNTLGVAASPWAGAVLTQNTIATILAITCNAAANGQVMWVKDTVALAAATFHGTVTGGGAATVNSLVSCNGTNWQYE